MIPGRGRVSDLVVPPPEFGPLGLRGQWKAEIPEEGKADKALIGLAETAIDVEAEGGGRKSSGVRGCSAFGTKRITV